MRVSHSDTLPSTSVRGRRLLSVRKNCDKSVTDWRGAVRSRSRPKMSRLLLRKESTCRIRTDDLLIRSMSESGSRHASVYGVRRISIRLPLVAADVEPPSVSSRAWIFKSKG
jgi:hypothetical protein